MEITVLGNQGPYMGPGGACSGYLVETKNIRILIDCGSGVLSNLQKVCDVGTLDAIILSHLHYDHMGDILVLKYLIEVSRTRNGIVPIKRIPIYCPASPNESFNLINKEIFEINVIDNSTQLNINDISISFMNVVHSVECYAIKMESYGKKCIYTADTGYTEKLIEFSKNAHLLIGDANFVEKTIENTRQSGKSLPHMTARENAVIARNARVKRLLLSHFWPFDDLNIYLKEAKEEFTNTVLSKIMEKYTI